MIFDLLTNAKDHISRLGLTCEVPTLVRPYVFPVPKSGSVFDFKLVIGTKPEWFRWEDDVDSAFQLPREGPEIGKISKE